MWSLPESTEEPKHFQTFTLKIQNVCSSLWHYIWSHQAVKKELPKIYSRTVIIEFISLIEFIIENIETDLNQQRWLQDFEKGVYKLSKGILQFHKVLS